MPEENVFMHRTPIIIVRKHLFVQNYQKFKRNDPYGNYAFESITP